MGSTTRSFSNTASWTFKYEYADEVKISGSSFNLSDVIPSVSAYAALPSGTWTSDIRGVADAYFTILGTNVSYSYGTWLTSSWPNKTWKTLSGSTSATKQTSDYFNSGNSTTRKIQIQASNRGTATISDAYYGITYTGNLANGTSDIGYLVLDVPPTATVSAMSYDKNFIYAGLTTASVTISDTAAYYGGSVTDVTLKIGTQTNSISGNGTCSILLDTAGTFTPTVTVTDSRGQAKVYSLSPITVLSYSAPTINFTADRTTSTGTPDDEGTYATCPSMFVFADAIADLIAPSVVLTDENGTQTTPVVNWYTTRASDGTLSDTISDWSNVSAGDTVYGLVSGLNTNYSYQISIRPRDSQGTGTAITQTVASAFYTIDFLAGGHGIAFGKPAANAGFECAMDATFEDTLTAQDMTAQEVQDFVDSLNISGETVSDWELLDSVTFSSVTTITHTVTVDTSKIVELAIFGACLSTSFPLVSGRTVYATTAYYYVSSAYTLRTYIDVSIDSASQLTIRYRLEAKGSSDSYPTYQIFYRYKEQ